MNYIIIKKITDLQKILVSSIHLEKKTAIEQRDILENTWAITFSDKIVKKLQVVDLVQFVTKLIKYRTEQLCQMNLSTNATLYIWFDEMALQIRFNVLSGENIELPFCCTLNVVSSYESIFQKYIKAASDNLNGNYYKINFIDKGDPGWDDDDDDDDDIDPKKFIQDVWVTTLRCD